MMMVTMAAAVEEFLLDLTSSDIVASGLGNAQWLRRSQHRCHERASRGQRGAVVRIGGAPPRRVVLRPARVGPVVCEGNAGSWQRGRDTARRGRGAIQGRQLSTTNRAAHADAGTAMGTHRDA
eukprot:4017288-Prymnesium_polylepis.1